jgi:hypothetical protein
MQAGFTHQEGQAAGYRLEHYHWISGKAPAGNRTQVDPRRVRPPPPRTPLHSARRAAAAAVPPRVRPARLRAARRRGEPALPTHARSCAWRPRVAAQGDMTGMGLNFVDGATCPRGTAPRCRDPKSRPLYYGRAGTFHAATALREMAVAYGPRCCQDTAKKVQDDSKSMSQHRERDRDRPLTGTVDVDTHAYVCMCIGLM